MDYFKSLLSRLVKEGTFGHVQFVGLESDDSTEIGAQFSSTLALLRLTVEGPSGDQQLSLVVKQPPFSDLNKMEPGLNDAMFHNEVAMYKEILPGLGACQATYPKLYYGSATGEVGHHLLVLENMNRNDFVLSKQKIFLDFEHVSFAIKRLAEFHSLSYMLKHKDKSRFLQMTNTLKEVVFPKALQENLRIITFATMERGIKPLIKNNIEIDTLNKCLNLLKDPFEVRTLVSESEEPYAVICHGDFCNNNVFFKYDDSGRPIDCAFFDFQLAKYASPAVDLFFFLYMHTTSSLREAYWDDILKIYWDTLRSELPSEVEIPSFQDYLKHLGERAIYGYLICSWFLPAIMDHHPASKPDYMTLSLDKKIERFVAVAGERGDQVTRNVALHLLNKGYINDFIQLCKHKKL